MIADTLKLDDGRASSLPSVIDTKRLTGEKLSCNDSLLSKGSGT
jgi:hypothetical protein